MCLDKEVGQPKSEAVDDRYIRPAFYSEQSIRQPFGLLNRRPIHRPLFSVLFNPPRHFGIEWLGGGNVNF